MRPLRDYVTSCTSLSEEQYCLRHPYSMLVHSVLSGELNPPTTPNGATMERLVIGGESAKDPTLNGVSGDDRGDAPESMFSVLPVVSKDPTALKIIAGSATSCDLQLPDQSVSREHAIFSRAGSDYYIVDNNSSAGTQVNDEVLMPAERRKLVVGDRITLGLVDLNYLPAGAFYQFVRRLCAT